MKNQVFILTVIASLSVSAHQFNNEKGNNTGWNSNGSSHTHAKSAAKSAASKSSPTGIVKGAKGLDATAEIGECYVTAYVEASCTNEAKKVLVQKAYDEIEVVPAITKEVERNVLVSAATTIEEYVPALYENVTKEVLIEAAHSEWKKGNSSSIQKVIDGDTYCLVEIPARYGKQVERILRIPASTKVRNVDAVYKNYKETIIITPETTRIVKSYPAVYKTVEECVEKSAGRYDWRSILCEENTTTAILKAVEQALVDDGYLLSGRADGVIDNSTFLAIKSYQRAKGLAVDGLVNIDTVKSLGVKY